MAEFIDVVFDDPPSSGRFVEVEDDHSRSTRVGRWFRRNDGFWVLRVQAGEIEAL